MQLFWCRHSNFLTFVFWVLGNKRNYFWHESNFVSPNKFWLNSKEQPWSVQHSTTLHWEDLGGLLSPQKETPCFDPDNEITLLRVILTMTFQNNHVRFYVSLIVSGEGRHTTHLLKCVRLLSTSQTDWRQSSNILSELSFDSLSDILPGISSDLWHISWHLRTFCLTLILIYFLAFFLTFLLTFFPTFFLAFCLTFFLAYLLTLFLTYLLTSLRLRSGTEH